MKEICGIYAILNFYNDNIYIGSSKNLRKRWNEHLNGLKTNTHYNNYLQRTFNKHWTSPFIFTILECCEINNLIELEQRWIDKLKPEYNLAPVAGSCLGFKHTEETKNLMSKPRKGRKFTEEHKANMRKGREMYKGVCSVCLKLFEKPMNYVRNNWKLGYKGPFCSRHCSAVFNYANR